MTYSATGKLEAVRRELAMRRRVYPRQVEARRMTPRAAEEQIAIFEDIEADYAALAEKERLL